MLVRLSVSLLVIVALCYGQSASTDRQCLPDDVDFAEKVEKSSVVVYGKAMAKIMYGGSESMFHVFYQVDCILKGPATLRQINITNAGRAPGRKYCQQFPVGRGYSIAFLEPISTTQEDFKTYVPADFAEIREEGNSTNQLLARTCNLHRIVPRQSLAAVTDVCPAVGTHPICHEIVSTTVSTTTVRVNVTEITKSETAINLTNATVLIPADKEHLSHPIYTPQQEIEAIRSKSSVSQVDADHNNAATSSTFSVLLLLSALAVFSY